MTPMLFGIVIVAELFLVMGQLVMKRSMLLTNRRPVPRGRFVAVFLSGVVAMGVYFFMWLGLMQRLDLSQQYAFDAVAPMLLVFAATVFLKERLTVRAWVGTGLICVGLVVVAFS